MVIIPGIPKKQINLVDHSDKNTTWIDLKRFWKYTSIANLKIDALFVHIGTLSVQILIFIGQTCLQLRNKASPFWPNQILEAQLMKSTKFEARGETLKMAQQTRLQITIFTTLLVNGPVKSTSSMSISITSFAHTIHLWKHSLEHQRILGMA